MANIINGTPGNDTLGGTVDHDSISGLAGDDILTGGEGNDVLDGGEGTDTAVYTGGLSNYGFGLDAAGNLTITGLMYTTAGSDTLIGIERLEFPYETLTRQELSAGNDSVAGNWLAGADGDDQLSFADYFNPTFLDGGAGNDTLSGGLSSVLIGGAGDDLLVPNGSGNIVHGGDGDDTFLLNLTQSAATLTGGTGQDLYRINSWSGPFGFGPRIDNEKVITDFAVGDGGDVIDIPTVLGALWGYTGDGFADPALRIIQEGGDALIQVDVDGTAAERTWETVYRLQGVWWTDLTLHNLGGYAALGLPWDNYDQTGLATNDFMAGQRGHDTLSGGLGDDTLVGNDGRDYLQGDDGNDSLIGGLGFDTLSGYFGDDSLSDYYGVNQLYGDQGDDYIVLSGGGGGAYGWTGDDTIEAGGISDIQIDAGEGNDVVSAWKGTVTLGAGRDLLKVHSIGEVAVVTDFQVGAGGDTIDLSGLKYLLNGYSGGDPFAAGYFTWAQEGADAVLYLDRDTSSGSLASPEALVRLQGVNLADLVPSNVNSFEATAGDDQLAGTEWWDAIDGLGGNDQIRGLGGDDSLTGSDGDDSLDGGRGNDTLSGDAGNDTLEGGKGSDLLTGGDGADTAAFSSGMGSYTVRFDALGQLVVTGIGEAASYGSDTLSGFEALKFGTRIMTRQELTSGNDGASGDWLAGGAGNDGLSSVNSSLSAILEGGDGNDTLSGSNNADVLIGGAGDDLLLANSGADFASGGDGNDSFRVNISTSSTLSGGNGQDIYQVLGSSSVNGNLVLNPILVTDFAAGDGGDVIRFDTALNLLKNYTGEGWGYNWRLWQDGADVRIDIDADGMFGARVFETAFLLQNVNLSNLTAANLGGYNPFGPTAGLTLSGDETAETLGGGMGSDAISGGGGNDSIRGEDGGDTLSGGDGNDSLFGAMGFDTLLGGAGNDLLLDSQGQNLFDGGAGDDIVQAMGGDAATIVGGLGDDIISFRAEGPSAIDSGSGNDVVQLSRLNATVTLGDGQDVVHVQSISPAGASVITDFQAGKSGDIISLRDITAGVSITDSNYYRLVQSGADTVVQFDRDGLTGGSNFVSVLTLNNVNAADLTGWNFIAPSASASGDALMGTVVGSALDLIDGLGGDDRIFGLVGDDTLIGNDGNDTLNGGLGSDVLSGGDGEDTAVFSGNRADYTITLSGLDATVTGADGTNTVSGVEWLAFADRTIATGEANNVAPTVTGDLKAVVDFNAAYVLTAADLGYSDPDDVAASISFSISNLKGGSVLVGGVVTTSFSAADLAAGHVAFQHAGASVAKGGFDVSVSDGNDSSAASTFEVTVNDTRAKEITGFDAGEIELISKNAAGVQANGGTGGYVGTPDGRYVLFSSSATNLVEGTPDDHLQHVYRKDLVTGEVLRVDGLDDGTIGNATAWATSISDDGSVAMFVSSATNFGATGSGTPYMAYTKNLITGEVSVVSTLPGGGIPDVGAFSGVLTADGTKAYYTAVSFNLGAGVPIDFSGMIYVKTLADSHTVRVDDFNSTHDWTFYSADLLDMTSDGGKILFSSNAPNLVAGDTNGWYDLFVLDTATGVINIASVTASGGALSTSEVMGGRLSADGEKVVFSTGAAGLTGTDPGGVKQVYVKDMATGAVTLISVDAAGHAGNAASGHGDFSADGNVVYFNSTATNLVAGDDNGQQDLFVYDLTTGEVTRVVAGNGLTYEGLSLSDDLYAFTSEANDLVAGDENPAYDAFLMHVTGNDSLTGGAGNDTITGKGGNDTLTGAAGDDVLEGGDGDDTAVFSGNRADYTVTVNGTEATIAGADGTDTVANVEWLRFADEMVAVAPVNVAPVLTGDLSATVAFGGEYVLTAADIGFTDPDDTEVFFDVSNVKGGGVFVNGAQTDGFSNEDLAAGLVTFRHGGYTASPAGFDITVTDEISTSAKAAFAVTVDDSAGRVVTGYDAGGIELISKNAAGEQANDVTGAYMGSGDGRYVVFAGNATNLVFDDQNDGQQHVYRKDLLTGEVVRIDTDDDGGIANSSSFAIDVSADGNLILFGSSASNLDEDGQAISRVFMKNVATGEVSVLADDLPNGGTVSLGFNGGFLGDASKVLFSAWSFDAPGPDDFMELLYVRALADGTVEQLTDFNAPGNWTYYQATFVDVTPDGSKVLFSSNAPYLTPNDFNNDYDMFVLDTATLAVSIVTAPASGEAAGGTVYFNGHISADGTKALFSSTSPVLTAADTGGHAQSYVKDLTTGEVTLISKNAGGAAGNGQSDGVVFSADGKTVYFASFADNLVAGDDNGVSDIFAYDLTTGGLERIVHGNKNSEWATSLTPDLLMFNSYATDLAVNDTNADLDVFLLHVTGNDNLTGGSGNDTLRGLGGNDTLDGGLGNDKLYGGMGNDTYYVDQTGDQVFENANEGIDTVVTAFSLKVGANIEKLVLSGTANTSAYGNGLANTLTGNSGNNTVMGYEGNDTLNGAGGNDKLDGGIDHDELSGGAGNDNLLGAEGSDTLDGGSGNDALNGGARSDTLTGGEGDDILDGGADNDQMSGGAGNDTYVVDHAGDGVNELLNEGTDTVKSSIDFTLSAHVENLYLTGSGNTSGTGNDPGNSMNGNSGHNTLSGGLGNDSLYGWDGNDSLVGGGDHDRLSGGNGNDTLVGGHGNDVVGGGAGADDFVFSSTAINGRDQISDFQHGLDHLVFAAADYGFAAGHVLTATEFTTGSTAVGTGAQFIWNDATDRLYFDADGTGVGAAFELAIVTGSNVTKDDLFFT